MFLRSKRFSFFFDLIPHFYFSSLPQTLTFNQYEVKLFNGKIVPLLISNYQREVFLDEKFESTLKMIGFILSKQNSSRFIITELISLFNENEQHNIAEILKKYLKIFDEDRSNLNYQPKIIAKTSAPTLVTSFVSEISILSIIFKLPANLIANFLLKNLENMVDNNFPIVWSDLETFCIIHANLKSYTHSIEKDLKFKESFTILKDLIIDLGRKEKHNRNNPEYIEKKFMILVNILDNMMLVEKYDRAFYVNLVEIIFCGKNTISNTMIRRFDRKIKILFDSFSTLEKRFPRIFTLVPFLSSSVTRFLTKCLPESNEFKFKYMPTMLDFMSKLKIELDEKIENIFIMRLCDNAINFSRSEIFSIISSMLKMPVFDKRNDLLKILVSSFFVEKNKNLSYFTKNEQVFTLIRAVHRIRLSLKEDDEKQAYFLNLKNLLVEKFASMPFLYSDRRFEELYFLIMCDIITVKELIRFVKGNFIFTERFMIKLKKEQIVPYGQMVVLFSKHGFSVENSFMVALEQVIKNETELGEEILKYLSNLKIA